MTVSDLWLVLLAVSLQECMHLGLNFVDALVFDRHFRLIFFN